MKSAINYKLINIALFLLVLFLIYQMRFILFKAISILSPIIISFLIAYILNPLINQLKKKINNKLAIIIVILLIIILLFLVIKLTLPIIIKELIILGNEITLILTKLDLKYNFINILPLKSIIYNNLEQIISSLSLYFDKGISILFYSIKLIGKLSIIVVLTIYMLFNFDKIKNKIKSIVSGKKIYLCLKSINKDLTSYLRGIGLIMLIEIFEYSIIYLIIGHPNYLLIAILASITTIIPIIGNVFTNIIALITASVISRKLFVLTALVILLAPVLDCYIIQPKIYKRTNKLSPMITIIMIVLCGSIFKTVGVILAVPIYIILSNVCKVYLCK